MKLSDERILTTHVGSLPRPPKLIELLLRRDAGEPYDQADFDKTVREAVDAIVARQVATGVDIVSDGESGKVGYGTYIKERLSGFGGEKFTARPQRDLADHPNFITRMSAFTGKPAWQRLCCVGPIAPKDRDAARTDIANLAHAVAQSRPADAFMNAASPGVVANFQPNRYYPTIEKYLEAIADAMREEYEAIVGAGFVLQVDCPDLAMSRHTGFQDLSEADFIKQAEQQVEALNHALRNVPETSVRFHVCWGNYEGPHDFDIPVEKILPVILKVKAQAISFEAANPRHAHEWVAWRDAKLPDNKVLIPGVLDTSTNFVEHPELVAQRIRQFADIVGRERVLAGTDCGFSTFVGHGKIDPEIAFKKLGSLAEGAAIASRALWRKTAA